MQEAAPDQSTTQATPQVEIPVEQVKPASSASGGGSSWGKWILGILAVLALVVMFAALFDDSAQDQIEYTQPTSENVNVTTVTVSPDMVNDFLALTEPSQAEVDGTLTFSGIKPQNEENGQVVLWQRKYGSGGDFVKVSTVAMREAAPWSFADAVTGNTYEIKASVSSQGHFIKDSDTLIVSAPATGQVLDFNVSTADIPQALMAQIESDIATYIAANADTTVSVSGVVEINGYLPTGSTITISQKVSGTDTAYVAINSGIAAADNAVFTWTDATLGTEYLFNAQLFNADGDRIGDSGSNSGVAPTSNLVLAINSTAVAPAPESQLSTISGIVELNGAVPDETSILILQRKPGESDYKEVTRIAAVNGITWKWSGATTGQVYEMTSALQYQGDNVTTSNMITATAPATGEKFILNSGWSVPTPKNTPSVSCGDGRGDTEISVNITYPKVDGAKQTRIMVGNEAGMSDVYNQYFGEVTADIPLELFVQKNGVYYASYKVAYCSDCSGDQYFSGSSPSTEFTCD